MQIKQHKTFNIPTLTAAVLLALGAGSAQAAINDGNPYGTVGTGSGSSGELFLSVWDATAQESYSLDLGVTVQQLLADQSLSSDGTAGQTWQLGSKFATFMANSQNDIGFNIAAVNAYQTQNIGTGATGILNTNYGVMLSNRYGLENGPIPGTLSNTALSLYVKGFTDRARYLSLAADQSNFQDWASNLSELTTDVSSNAYALKFSWDKFGKNLTTVSATPSEMLSMYFLHLSAGPANLAGMKQPTAADLLGTAGDYAFKLDVNAGTLSWVSNATAVPLPAGAWLMISGLTGLLGLQRRRRATI